MAQPFETYLDCFLWDLVDEGIDTVLDRIKGEIGVKGIVVPVHHSGVQQFRPHAGVSPRTFQSKGGAEFQPDSSRYAATRIRPVVDDWLRKSNPFKTVVQACKDRGLKIGAAIRACAASPIARQYEHAAVRDVWGDRDDWLCPVNPDVQEYVRSLLTDLSENYPIDSVVLNFLGYGYTSGGTMWSHTNEHQGFSLGPVETWLRSICFCESCRQLAKRDGVDVDRAARVVTEALESACDSGERLKDTLSSFAQDHAELNALLEWRMGQLHAWIGTLKTSCQCELVMGVHQEPLRSGLDVRKLADYHDAVLCSTRQTDPKEVESSIRWSSDVWSPDRVCVRVGAGACCADSGSLVAAVSLAAKSGCRAVHIADYGSIPQARLDWVRQAVRFAHREARAM
jgi:hypothetical protein